jgi:hypothetical protein
MADHLQNPSPRDRIEVHEPRELRYWSDKFGVEPRHLREAVIIVGPLVKDVEQFLRKTNALRVDSAREPSGLGRQ